VCGNHILRVNRTLSVEINLLVRVEITFMPVEITLRVEITLCMYKLHSVCRNHTLRV
jgi:hypothetical protein